MKIERPAGFDLIEKTLEQFDSAVEPDDSSAGQRQTFSVELSVEVWHYVRTAFREIINKEKNGYVKMKEVAAALNINKPNRPPLKMDTAEKSAWAHRHVDLVQKEMERQNCEVPDDEIFAEVAEQVVDEVPETERPDRWGIGHIPGHSPAQIERDWFEYQKFKKREEGEEKGLISEEPKKESKKDFPRFGEFISPQNLKDSK